MVKIESGALSLTVTHSGYNAYGRARYVVVVRRDGESTALFESAALELPWRDDQRALRDALGFLAYYLDEYVLDGVEPDEGSGVTLAELGRLAPFAAEFADMAAELEEA